MFSVVVEREHWPRFGLSNLMLWPPFWIFANHRYRRLFYWLSICVNLNRSRSNTSAVSGLWYGAKLPRRSLCKLKYRNLGSNHNGSKWYWIAICYNTFHSMRNSGYGECWWSIPIRGVFGTQVNIWWSFVEKIVNG